jgi:hypothetical protein
MSRPAGAAASFPSACPGDLDRIALRPCPSGRLRAHCLAIVDESGLPAFLETPNLRNVGFYERQGFVITATTRSASCPPLTSMLRAGAGARSSR